ncbi:MAG TPA: diguanylate cyclase [Steroidobacteraceae bacterium]|nr:diguanylate cyclase [Steroidobacteraceae bacterium]
MSGLSNELLRQMVESSPDGIVVCKRASEGWLVVFVNRAFERLTGFSAQDLKGRDLRLLQGEDRDQEQRQRLRQALADGESCRALLRNYRSDGTQFWNEMVLVPLTNGSGSVDHFVSFHRDARERMRIDQKAPGRENAAPATAGAAAPAGGTSRDDRLTGLHCRQYFDEALTRDWAVAQRDGLRLALVLLDIDALGTYNETFGRPAGDSCVKRVARAIASCLRRGSDLTARLDGGTIAALIHSMTAEQALPFTDGILERVREQRIHHPRSSVFKYVTVSAGLVSTIPGPQDKIEHFVERARAALKDAKTAGRNRAVAAKS